MIGSDYSQFRPHLACHFANVSTEPSFTDWLFEEAAKGVSGPEIAQSPPPTIEQATDPEPSHEATSNIVNDSSRTAPGASRNGVYQQAITQALPPTPTSAQKRTASARSPSPGHPHKARRTDLPVGPRAMYRDANSNSSGNPHSNSRSLLDRVGGPPGRPGPKNFQRDEIQARIDNIVGNTPDPNMMMAAGFPGMGMDMNAIAAANMANPIMLQEMMMSQMALMAQMASSMGIINPNTGQFGGQGFPMQQGMPGVMPGDMGMFPNGMVNGLPQQGGNNGSTNGAGRGRGSVRGARGSSRGRGGPVGGNSAGSSTNTTAATFENPQVPPAQIIAEPKPITPSPTLAPSATGLIATSATPQQPAYAIPDRPQSPTLCKFALKCTNAHCRYSHPSPVATAESGIVLSNEACANGKECKDKDCIKAHVSPAVLNPLGKLSFPKIFVPAYLFSSAAEQPAPVVTALHVHHTPSSCRFGATCTRPNCTFSHPPRPSHNHFAQQCRFGAGCTRAQCPFQHPEGRVLPSSFHRGLTTAGPMVNVPTPEPGSMGGPSPHRSVTFNNATSASVKEKLQQQMKEIQEKKSEAEKAVRNAEAAAGKKDEAKPVSIAV